MATEQVISKSGESGSRTVEEADQASRAAEEAARVAAAEEAARIEGADGPVTETVTPPVPADDRMPIHGIDHVELYVGNAAQAAFYFVHAFGFTETAYAGLETGRRDRGGFGCAHPVPKSERV